MANEPTDPHSLPVSTVQALIEAESDHARIERQLRAEIDTLRGVRDDLKARLKAALLASPSLHRQEQEEDVSRVVGECCKRGTGSTASTD